MKDFKSGIVNKLTRYNQKLVDFFIRFFFWVILKDEFPLSSGLVGWWMGCTFRTRAHFFDLLYALSCSPISLAVGGGGFIYLVVQLVPASWVVVLYERESEILMTGLWGAREAIVELFTLVGGGHSLSRAYSADAVGATCDVASTVWRCTKGQRPLVFHADLLCLILRMVKGLRIKIDWIWCRRKEKWKLEGGKERSSLKVGRAIRVFRCWCLNFKMGTRCRQPRARVGFKFIWI